MPPNKPPSQSPRQRPAGRGLPQKSRVIGVSNESEFIGYLVLGFGILAVIAVLLIAVNRFGGSEGKPQLQQAQSESVNPQTVQPPVTTNTKETHNRIAQDLLGGIQSPPEKPKAQTRPAAKKDLYFTRQPNLKPESIAGAWQAMIGSSTAVLQINAGTYQIVLADPKEYSRRLYSSGTYKILDDMVVLSPRMDWSAPTPPVGTDVFYQSITTAPFPVMVGMKGGRMLWQNPPSTETRVYVPRSMPLMQNHTQGFITWQRVK